MNFDSELSHILTVDALYIEMFHLTSLSRDTSLAPPALVYSFIGGLTTNSP